jgi:DNA-binding winged helix-turn-helix (wHTH) protein
VYQAAARPTAPPADTVRVVLVFDVPAGSPELPSRTAQLADEFGRLIAHSVPGVRARKALVSTGPSMVASAARPQGLTIDRFSREVRIDGERVRLTYREFELLCFLAARPRRPVSRVELMREVWQDRSPDGDVSLRTVDTHVRRLRVKLGPHARVLTTIRGRGYRFDPGPDVRYVAA